MRMVVSACDRQPWMGEEEWKRYRAHRRWLVALFEGKGVADSPMLAWRAEDLLTSLFLVHRTEQLLMVAEAESSTAAAMEQVWKARERLRKAQRELEDYCARMGTPVDVGLADVMRPIVLKARSILGDDAG